MGIVEVLPETGYERRLTGRHWAKPSSGLLTVTVQYDSLNARRNTSFVLSVIDASLADWETNIWPPGSPPGRGHFLDFQRHQMVTATGVPGNRTVKRTGRGVRIVPCYLPVKSPWLNRMEPRWTHAKQHIVEPDRTLTAQELAERVCTHFGCPHEPHLSISKNVT